MSVKSIMSQNPCATCTADKQEGNPYNWQTPCHNCKKKLEWELQKATRIQAIEAILGDDYDLDRLRELVEADRDGRCMVLPAGCYHNNPVTRYIAAAVVENLTREAAEVELKGEQDGTIN